MKVEDNNQQNFKQDGDFYYLEEPFTPVGEVSPFATKYSLKKFQGRVIVLDIDDTLVKIFRRKTSEMEQTNENKEDNSDLELPTDFSWISPSGKHHFAGYKRPGLEKFIDWLCSQVDEGNIFLGVWTTASYPYARTVLNFTFGAERMKKIGFLWHRTQFMLSKRQKSLQKLADVLEYPINKIIMIDDNGLGFDPLSRISGIVWLLLPYHNPKTQQEDTELNRIQCSLSLVVARYKRKKYYRNVTNLSPTESITRQQIINHMIYLDFCSNLSPETLYVAIHIFDKLYSKRNYFTDHLIILATACLYLSACHCETKEIPVESWIKYSDNQFNVHELGEVVKTIHKQFIFPIIDGTEIPFIHLNAIIFDRNCKEKERMLLLYRSHYCLELCLLDDRYRTFDPESLATTIVRFSWTYGRKLQSSWKRKFFNFGDMESKLWNFVHQCVFDDKLFCENTKQKYGDVDALRCFQS